MDKKRCKWGRELRQNNGINQPPNVEVACQVMRVGKFPPCPKKKARKRFIRMSAGLRTLTETTTITWGQRVNVHSVGTSNARNRNIIHSRRASRRRRQRRLLNNQNARKVRALTSRLRAHDAQRPVNSQNALVHSMLCCAVVTKCRRNKPRIVRNV